MDNKLRAEQLRGIYGELAAMIGVEAAQVIHQNYRGTQLFFPIEFYSNEYIYQKIVDEYDGKNIRHLATKYGYTEKWIRKILKEKKNEKE